MNIQRINENIEQSKRKEETHLIGQNASIVYVYHFRRMETARNSMKETSVAYKLRLKRSVKGV